MTRGASGVAAVVRLRGCKPGRVRGVRRATRRACRPAWPSAYGAVSDTRGRYPVPWPVRLPVPFTGRPWLLNKAKNSVESFREARLQFPRFYDMITNTKPSRNSVNPASRLLQ